MEIRNTASERESEWLDTPELMSQLAIALRNVAVYERDRPDPSGTMVKWVEMVQRLHRILLSRGADLGPELEAASAQTGWRLEELLAECLDWPSVSPRVRDADGIRRMQRCWFCRRREFPEEAGEKFCDECLLELIEMIRRKTPPDGNILFRTYNQSLWCAHADAETVLMAADEYDLPGSGRCTECLAEEYRRRHPGGTPV